MTRRCSCVMPGRRARVGSERVFIRPPVLLALARRDVFVLLTLCPCCASRFIVYPGLSPPRHTPTPTRRSRRRGGHRCGPRLGFWDANPTAGHHSRHRLSGRTTAQVAARFSPWSTLLPAAHARYLRIFLPAFVVELRSVPACLRKERVRRLKSPSRACVHVEWHGTG